MIYLGQNRGGSRYPGIDNDTLWVPYEEYIEEDALDVAQKAKQVIEVARDFYQYWFKLEGDNYRITNSNNLNPKPSFSYIAI